MTLQSRSSYIFLDKDIFQILWNIILTKNRDLTAFKIIWDQTMEINYVDIPDNTLQ